MEHDDYLYVFPVINYKEITSFSYGHNKPNDVDYRVRVMVFNITFNNISIISWRSVLLVEETEIPRENH
jgi:hypothetical protein